MLTDEDTGGRLPAGAWEVRYRADSTTEVRDPFQRPMLAARYVVRGDTLLVRDAAGPLACPPATGPAPDAVYAWRLDGERLTLQTLSHPCAGQSGTVLEMTRQPDAAAGAAPGRGTAAQPPAAAPSAGPGFPAGRYGIVVRAEDADGPITPGRWEMQFGADGRSALRDPQGTPMVEGTYAVRGDTLLLTDVSGPLSCAQTPEVATAILTWAVAGPRLLLRTVEDPCEGRRQAFVGMNTAGFVRIPDAAREAGRDRARPAPSTPPHTPPPTPPRE